MMFFPILSVLIALMFVLILGLMVGTMDPKPAGLAMGAALVVVTTPALETVDQVQTAMAVLVVLIVREMVLGPVEDRVFPDQMVATVLGVPPAVLVATVLEVLMA